MRENDVIEHIQRLCNERNWSYYRLSKEADIPYSTLNNLINRTNIPTIPTLQKLCDGFGITLADFFQENTESTRLTQSQEEVVAMYNRLDHQKKEVLKAYMKGLLMDT